MRIGTLRSFPDPRLGTKHGYFGNQTLGAKCRSFYCVFNAIASHESPLRTAQLPGSELPTIWSLEEQLLFKPNTVGRAYRESEFLGVVAQRSAAETALPTLRHVLRVVSD